MKTIRSLLFLIALGWLLSSCGTAPQPTATQLAESMKGYELYSWQEGEQWVFSLLVGTNREKTVEEIKSTESRLPGVEALVSRLDQVPSGQYVTWTARETLPFPPDDILQQVEQSCKDKGLMCNIAR
jgi:hypothetical protein